MVVVLEPGLELDPERFELRRDGAVVSLEPQTFDVLAYLVENRHRLVTKEELMDRVSGGRFATEPAGSVLLDGLGEVEACRAVAAS